MAQNPYLIAIALIEQDGKRSMPLGGKSIPSPIYDIENSCQLAEAISLELLVRVMQRSEKGLLRRIAGDKSLLLIQMPFDSMQEKLPLYKAAWIKSGNTEVFLEQLRKFTSGIWILDFQRYEGISFINYFQ